MKRSRPRLAVLAILSHPNMPEAVPNIVIDKALKLPIFEQLRDKRVILASSSPNRKEAMERMVRFTNFRRTGAGSM